MSKCNMRTARSLVAAVVAASGLSLSASTSRARAGGGGPPTTTIYYETSGLSVLNKVNSDGSGATVLANYGPYAASGSYPSYQLHGGRRWFVRSGWTDGTYTQLDLYFLNDAGATLAYPIDPDLANDNLGAARWVPVNDGEVSVIGQQASNGEIGMFAIPITFDTFGNPTPGTPYLKLVTSFF